MDFCSKKMELVGYRNLYLQIVLLLYYSHSTILYCYSSVPNQKHFQNYKISFLLNYDTPSPSENLSDVICKKWLHMIKKRFRPNKYFLVPVRLFKSVHVASII